MKSQVEEALEAELLKRAQKDLKHVAITVVREGPGVIINEPLKSRYDQILHNYVDRNSILGSEEVTPASAAFNRARYALANAKDLGPGTFVRAIGDLWREGGGTCVRKDVAEEVLVNQMMIGTPGQPKIEAAKLLSTTCGTLTPVGGRTVLHSLGVLAERLKEGHEYRPVGAKLAGIDLSGLDLRGAELVGANLTKANLDRTNLSGARLSGVKLGGAKIREADLRGADLTRSNTTDALFNNSDLSFADMSEAWLAGTNFDHVNFSSAKLVRTKLHESRLTHADFTKADLREASLRNDQLNSTNFTQANLTGADLGQAKMGGAQLSGADLTGASRSMYEDPIHGYIVVDGKLKRGYT